MAEKFNVLKNSQMQWQSLQRLTEEGLSVSFPCEFSSLIGALLYAAICTRIDV
jgi:hypothetical protein